MHGNTFEDSSLTLLFVVSNREKKLKYGAYREPNSKPTSIVAGPLYTHNEGQDNADAMSVQGASVGFITRAMQGANINYVMTYATMESAPAIFARTIDDFVNRNYDDLVSHLRAIKVKFTQDGSTNEEELAAALRHFFKILNDANWEGVDKETLKSYVSAALDAGLVNGKGYKYLFRNVPEIKHFWSNVTMKELKRIMGWVLSPSQRGTEEYKLTFP